MDATDKKHYVYFVHAGSKKDSPVKVGVTTDIHKRLAKMQTGNHNRLICKSLLPCANKAEAYALESFIHSRIWRHRINGEWFRCEYFNLPSILSDFNESNGAKVKPEKTLIATSVIDRAALLSLENQRLRKLIKNLEQEIEEFMDSQLIASARDRDI